MKQSSKTRLRDLRRTVKKIQNQHFLRYVTENDNFVGVILAVWENAEISQFFKKKLKKHNDCPTGRKRETVIENETSRFDATSQMKPIVRPHTLKKVAKV